MLIVPLIACVCRSNKDVSQLNNLQRKLFLLKLMTVPSERIYTL